MQDEVKNTPKEKDIKVDADVHFHIYVTCPHCDCWQDRKDDLVESLPQNSLNAEDIDCELRCDRCKEYFTVENINY